MIDSRDALSPGEAMAGAENVDYVRSWQTPGKAPA
jgi:hypothetical protein